MYYEYCNYNTQKVFDHEFELAKIFKLLDRGFGGVCSDIFFARKLKGFLPEGIVLSCPVDYPLGKSDKKVREHETITNLKSGANAIDLVCHRQYLLNNDWISLKEDISTIKNICNDYNATLRVMTNWTDDEDTNIILNIAKLLQEFGMDIFIPSIAFHNDDFVDNLVVSHVTQADTSIPTICNGYMYLDKHVEQFKKATVFGLRLYHSNYKLVYSLL